MGTSWSLGSWCLFHVFVRILGFSSWQSWHFVCISLTTVLIVSFLPSATHTVSAFTVVMSLFHVKFPVSGPWNIHDFKQWIHPSIHLFFEYESTFASLSLLFIHYFKTCQINYYFSLCITWIENDNTSLISLLYNQMGSCIYVNIIPGIRVRSQKMLDSTDHILNLVREIVAHFS